MSEAVLAASSVMVLRATPLPGSFPTQPSEERGCHAFKISPACSVK